MPRVTNDQLMSELKRLESDFRSYRSEDEVNRLKLRDDIEKQLEQKLRDYVLQVVFQSELKPIKQFMAGVVTTLLTIAGGIGLWLITQAR